MKQLYFLFIMSFLLNACSSKNETIIQNGTIIPWNSSLSMEQNMAKNAIALKNDLDFSFLDKIVDGRSIIILGEEGHLDNSTSEIKIKMIDYLRDKGFNSIIFEGTPLLTSYIFSNPQYAELTKEWDLRIMSSGPVRNDKRFQPFLTALQERKIKLWGKDLYTMTIYDIDAVKTILNKYNDYEILVMDWDKLREFYLRKFVNVDPEYPDYNKHSVDEQYELMRMIDTLSNYVQYIMFSKETTMELKVIMQWIRDLNTAFSFVEEELKIANVGQTALSLSLRNRDYQMAENVAWIVENFPEEKFIVWTANFHGAKDISQTRYPADSLFYFTFQSMGETLANKYKEKMYSLAFVSNRSEDEIGELEKEIINTTGNAPYAFIDYESLRFADGYRDKEFESSVIIKKQGKWQYIFDGLYYIRDFEYAFPDSIKK
jgi:erythromycin esterase